MAKGITPTGAIVTGELVQEGGDTYIRVTSDRGALLYYVERIIIVSDDEMERLREGDTE